MADVSVLVYDDRRRRSRSWVWSMAVTVAAATAGLGGLASLDRVGRPDSPPLLRASFVGPASPDVRIQSLPAVDPLMSGPPATPSGPIDVPADPYADEAIVEVGSLEIPKLGVQQRLMDGVTLRNIDLGPSHWPGSAWPGEPGNMVVAGHRVTHSRPFRNIDQLVPGDQIVVTARGVRASYRVAYSQVVTPDKTEIANPTAIPSLTLFACHPPGSARQRYVVRAELEGTQAV